MKTRLAVVPIIVAIFEISSGCTDRQKACGNGLCVYHLCPEELCTQGPDCARNCSAASVFCSSDGSCAGPGQRCPCPATKPHHCSAQPQTDDRCYSDVERCNGLPDCPNGADESNCSSVYTNVKGPWFYIATATFFFVCMVMVFIGVRMRKKRSSAPWRGTAQESGERPPCYEDVRDEKFCSYGIAPPPSYAEVVQLDEVKVATSRDAPAQGQS